MSKDLGATDSVSKCLRALLLLAAHDSMRVTDLSRELDVAVSTAHRLLGIMRAQDFVEQDSDSRRYRLGPAALKLGRRAGGQNLMALAHPHLARLCTEVDETVNLIVMDGADALFLDGVESRQPLRVATRTGARLPAYATAGGKVLLAYVPFPIVRTLYAEGLSRATRFTVADLAALDRELAIVREQGFALNLGEHLAEVFAIGVRVEGSRGKAIAALTMAGPSTRWDRKRLTAVKPRLDETAARIAQAVRDHGP